MATPPRTTTPTKDGGAPSATPREDQPPDDATLPTSNANGESDPLFRPPAAIPQGNALNNEWKQKLLERQRKFIKKPSESTTETTGTVEDDEEQLELETLKANLDAAKAVLERKRKSGEAVAVDEIEVYKRQKIFQRRLKKAQTDLTYEAEDDGVVDPVSSIRDLRAEEENAALQEGLTAYLDNSDASDDQAESSAPTTTKQAKPKTGRPIGSKNKRQKQPATRGLSKVQKSKKPKKLTKKEIAAARRAANRFNDSNLLNQDIFRDATTNQALETGPTFTAKRKNDALKELISSIPAELQDIARIDKKQLQDALKLFTPPASVQPDGANDGWKMKGMSSTLSHYQMLGVSFMREREQEDQKPRGGILADSMGLGKTVMCIANIVNGFRKKENQVTLIVLPNTLVTQWEEEFRKHGVDNAYGGLIRYHAGSKLKRSRDTVVENLTKFNVIITTYETVRQSYPKWSPPAEATTAEAKAAWWKQYYHENKGALHCIEYYRVILDEAQAIKSVDSQTSVSCRSLTSQRHWAMSGTPVLNRLEEFYPYFRFLKVPSTGSLRVFRENFCTKADGSERLHAMLRGFMIRRTHNDELFGTKLLALKTPTKFDHKCHFSEIERELYDVVRYRFIARINTYVRTGEVNNKYSNILTMTLRLRQIAAHPLLIQDTLRDLLEKEDIEKLRNICEKPVEEHMQEWHVLQHLKMMLKHDPQELPVIDSLAGATAELDTPDTNEGGQQAVELAQQVLDGIQQMDQTSSTIQPDDTGENREKADDVSANANEENIEQVQDGNDQTTSNTYSHNTHHPNVTGTGTFGTRNDYGTYFDHIGASSTLNDVLLSTPCTYCKASPARHPHKTSCQHVYCQECLLFFTCAAIDRHEQPQCLACGARFHGSEAYLPTTIGNVKPSNNRGSPSPKSDTETTHTKYGTKRNKAKDIVNTWVDPKGHMLTSAKTLAFTAAVSNWLTEDPTGKIIVYTQFISMIHILGRICEMENWGFVDFHGGLTIEQRQERIRRFKENDGTKVMLSSLKTGGTGLNLTMACRVVVVDLWWNNAIEDQAFARTFRRGQTKACRLLRLIVSESIDDQIVDMQRRKERAIGDVIDNDAKKNKRLSPEELLSLFGPVETDQNGRAFIITDDEMIERAGRVPRVGREGDDELLEEADEA